MKTSENVWITGGIANMNMGGDAKAWIFKK